MTSCLTPFENVSFICIYLSCFSIQIFTSRTSHDVNDTETLCNSIFQLISKKNETKLQILFNGNQRARYENLEQFRGKPRDKTNEKASNLEASNVNKYLNTDQIKSKIFRNTGYRARGRQGENFCCGPKLLLPLLDLTLNVI